MAIPDRSEAAEYFFTYINQVPHGEICGVLDAQATALPAFLGGISDERSTHRYAPDKWSIRQVLNHVNDAERLFVSRAFWFARGFDSPLPSFDQNVAVAASRADDRSWQSHVDEFRAIRAGTLTFFRSLAADAWVRRGTASGKPFTVNALAYIAAGHAEHHAKLIRERYL